MKENYRSAKRYAKAVFDFAQEKKILETVLEELRAVRHLIAESTVLQDFLRSPAITHQKRRKVLEHLFKERLNRLTYNFILFLGEKGKLFLLRKACEVFEDMYLAAKNILRVQLISAQPLEHSQVKTIGERLKSKLNKDVILSLEKDERLLGGFTIKINDTVYDFSLITQLERFRQNVVFA